MNEKYNSLIVSIVSLLILIILLIIPKINEGNKIGVKERFNNNLKTIRSTMSKGFKLESSNYLSNGIINYVYKNDRNGNCVTFFIDNNTGDVVSYRRIIKSKFNKDFDEVEQKLLNEKYPKFIVDAINQNNVTKYFEVKDNEIIIHYSNVVSTPYYSEPIFLVINNNEVSKYLNYSFSLDETYKNESAYEYDPTKQYIAFSFDDGPSRNNTFDIVNYLENNKSHATFFMLGSFMNPNPDIVKYVKEHGMEIGSHTYSHTNLKKLNASKLDEEIYKTNEVYNSITGENLKLLRPPYGSMNDKIKDSYPYSFILWSVDTLDWKYKDSDYLYDYVINNVSDGDIVLMHDIHETTKIGVEKILPELYVRGYRVVSVSELARIKGIELTPNTKYRSLKK